MVADIAMNTDILISGIGGIVNWKDVVEYILAGAAASHNWWKFDLAISYTLLPSQSILLSNQCFL
jgi:hypothetical protein